MPLTMRPTGLASPVDKDQQDFTIYSGDCAMGRIYESAMHLRGPAAVAEAPVAAAWDTAASALLPCPMDRIAGSETTMMTCSHPVERSQRHPSSCLGK
jgi:hypothetical protein